MPEAALADALWSDEDADAAVRALRAAVHRLRALLGGPHAVLVRDSQIRLNTASIWVDAWAFEAALERGRAKDGMTRELIMAQALEQYHGAFLADDLDSTCILVTREHLRAKFLEATAQLASAVEAKGNHEQAAELCTDAAWKSTI